MSTASRIKKGVAIAITLALGLGAYQYLYALPKGELVKALHQQQTSNAAFEKALLRRSEIRSGLKAVANSTLGATKDEVDTRFRTALHSIAASCALTGISVNTQAPDKQENPMAGAKNMGASYSRIKSEMRKGADFYVVPGMLTGTGTLDQVLRTAAMVKQQPWVHRVQSFSLKPVGKERSHFELRLGVSTILLPPDLAPKERGEPVVLALSDSADSTWKKMVQKNIFREPPPPAAPAVAAQPPAEPPPVPSISRPAYDDWKLTGVVQSRLGIEAFLVNTKSGQRMTLPTGSAVADARFVEGSGERAVFEIDGQQFEIINGQTLEQRRPLTR
jgi:hypothetical protein